MAKKSHHGSVGGGGEEKKNKEGNNGGGEIEIVVRTNLHCDGCCKKIRKAILRFPGVRTVEFEGECQAKIVAAGSVDPPELRTLLEKKTNKHVEILSPLPKKGDKKDKGQKSENDKPKEKEPPVTTVVLRVASHCDGCSKRIHKAISSYKGVYEVSIDKDKDTVTVKGKMDANKMAKGLREKLRKPVEIIPEKKKDQKEKKDNGGGDSNKREKEEGGGKGTKGGDKTLNVEQFVVGSGCFHKDEFGHLVDPFHGPHFFSDENPNGCSVM